MAGGAFPTIPIAYNSLQLQVPYEKTLKTFLLGNIKKRYNYKIIKNINFKKPF